MKDWYILGPREFYKKHFENYGVRRKILRDGDTPYPFVDPLPLGESPEDDVFKDAEYRRLCRLVDGNVREHCPSGTLAQLYTQ